MVRPLKTNTAFYFVCRKFVDALCSVEVFILDLNFAPLLFTRYCSSIGLLSKADWSKAKKMCNLLKYSFRERWVSRRTELLPPSHLWNVGSVVEPYNSLLTVVYGTLGQ